MGGASGPGILDHLVDWLARAMDALGFQGSRLRWKWNQKRRDLGEAGFRALLFARSARAQFKMCPSCRTLVPKNSWRCEACGAGLASVRAPGLGRFLSNLLPGATTATGLIFLVNGVLFVLLTLAPVTSAADSDGGVLGRIFRVDIATLLRFGAGWGPLTFGAGEWWRLVTPVFLHGGLLHIVFNSMVLLQLGPLVEEEYGTERFFASYMVAGICGNLASQGLGRHPTVGASSAILGLMGLLLVYGFRRGGVFGQSLRSAMGRYAIYVFIFSLLPGVDFLSHAGGFLGGCALGFVLPPGSFRSRATAYLWELLAIAMLGLVLVSFGFAAWRGEEIVRWLQQHGRL